MAKCKALTGSAVKGLMQKTKQVGKSDESHWVYKGNPTLDHPFIC